MLIEDHRATVKISSLVSDSFSKSPLDLHQSTVLLFSLLQLSSPAVPQQHPTSSITSAYLNISDSDCQYTEWRGMDLQWTSMPWGIPTLIVDQADLLSLVITLCCRLVRKLFSHPMVFPSTASLCRVSTRILSQRILKALEKLKLAKRRLVNQVADPTLCLTNKFLAVWLNIQVLPMFYDGFYKRLSLVFGQLFFI